MTAVVKLERTLGNLSASIRDGYKRATQGGSEWLDGSLEVAAAMYEARGRFPSNKEFGDWLENEGYGPKIYNPQDRAALINLGSDIPRARVVMRKSQSTCYQLIWESVKAQWDAPVFLENSKTTEEPKKRIRRKGGPKPGKRTDKTTLKENMRRTHLGADTMAKIADTSLNTPKELDALIHLKDHYVPVYNQVIEQAAAGEAVSAVAAKAKIARDPPPKPDDVFEIFTKHSHRFLAGWIRLDTAARHELFKLMLDIKRG